MSAAVTEFAMRALQETNRQLRERVEELEETVRQLRDRAAPAPDALPDWLPYLTKYERLALLALLPGRLVSKDQMMEALYGDGRREAPGDKMPDVWIHKLRRKLAGVGIEIITFHARGHQLSANSRALLTARTAKAA